MKNANELFNEHSGCLDRYRYQMGLVLTGGVKDVAEKLSCFWFLDIIASYQIEPKFRKEEFQVWILKRVKEGEDEFLVTCEDGNDNIVGTQKIPFSDFPHDLLTLWMVDKTILLPSEY